MTTPVAISSEPNILLSWMMLLRRRWLLGVIVFALVFGYSAQSVLLGRTVYRADSKLRIGEPPPTTGVGAGSLMSFMRMGGDPFANDLELMASRTVTEGVVRDAVLALKVTAPKGWHRDSLFSAVTMSDSTTRASFEARWVGEQIDVVQKAPAERTVGTFRPGMPVLLGGVRVTFRPRKTNGPESITLATIPMGQAVRESGEKIKPIRKRRDANVVEIAYTHTDPAVARLVVQSVVTRFMELRTRIAQRESFQNVDSLRSVSRTTLAELTRAEADLETLQREKLLVDVGAQSEAFVERYSTATSNLEMARAELQAVDAALARSRSTELAAQRWTSLLAFRPFLDNATIGELLAQLTTLEAQRAGLAPRRTENNRDYALVLAQIDYIDKSLAALASDVRAGIAEQIEVLAAQVVRMDAALAAVPAGTIELARRQRNARVLSEVLVQTEQRLRQEELRQALSFSNIQIIDPAQLQFKPVWPRKKVGLAIGWMVAFITAVLAIAVVEQADRRVRTAGQVMRLTGAPVLGIAVRRKHGLDFSPLSLRSVVHHSSANGRGPTRVLVAPVGGAPIADLLASMRQSFGPADDAGLNGAHAPEVIGADAIDSFPNASAAAGPGIPVTLAIEALRTRQDQLERAALLVRQAGGEVGGVVVICRTENQARDVWR